MASFTSTDNIKTLDSLSNVSGFDSAPANLLYGFKKIANQYIPEIVTTTINNDLDMNGFNILHLGDPVGNEDGVNKQYADGNYVNVSGDVMSGRLGVEVTDPIQGILQVGDKANGTTNNHLDDDCPIVANLDIANDPLGRNPMICLNRSGISGQFYGNIAVFTLGRYEDVSSNSRSSLGLGLAHGAITVGSTIPEVITFKSSGEIDMVGPLNLDTKRITGVDTPVNNNDAVNKLYVDNLPTAVPEYYIYYCNNGGGTNTGYTTIPLNTSEWQDPNNNASLASNRFTLQSGQYYIDGYASAFHTLRSQVIFYNITTSTVDAIGQSVFARDNISADVGGNLISITVGDQIPMNIAYRVNITTPYTYEMRTWSQDGATNGRGVSSDPASGLETKTARITIVRLGDN